MIVDYKIVSAAYEGGLEEEVSGLLKHGWQPQGGMSFIPETSESKMWFAQAMVLNDGTNE
jgi:hypothetical protein